MPKAVLTALRKASQGLLYPSETDEPFEAFTWGKAAGDLTPATVLQLAKAAPKTAVEEVPLADVCKNLTLPDNPDADKFKGLFKVVNDHLSGVRVFQVGKVNLDVYLVGKTKDGDWAGLKTKAVET